MTKAHPALSFDDLRKPPFPRYLPLYMDSRGQGTGWQIVLHDTAGPLKDVRVVEGTIGFVPCADGSVEVMEEKWGAYKLLDWNATIEARRAVVAC